MLRLLIINYKWNSEDIIFYMKLCYSFDTQMYITIFQEEFLLTVMFEWCKFSPIYELQCDKNVIGIRVSSKQFSSVGG